MLDGLVLPHELIERIGVVASHEEPDEARALPPDTLLVVLGEEEPSWQSNGDRLSGPGPLESQQLSDTVP